MSGDAVKSKRRKTQFCTEYSAIKAFNAELGSNHGPCFSMGLDTMKVPMSMHASNRSRLVEKMRMSGHGHGVVLLQGGGQKTQYCSDTEIIFRQESYMNYLFGIKEVGCYGAIDLRTGTSTLFIPELPVESAIWQGAIKPKSHFVNTYAVDEVRFDHELDSWMQEVLRRDSIERGAAGESQEDWAPVFLLHGLNTDSMKYTETTADFLGLKAYRNVDRESLHTLLAECRVVKSPDELRLMRYVSWITSMAHVETMRSIEAGMTEYQLESLFRHYTYSCGGCRHQAYTCICACGPNAGTLHYGHAGAPNDRILEEGDIALLDMGAEYHCYCSDITCSYPVSGTFTIDQRLIFEGVLAAQKAVYKHLRPGCDWVQMHRLTWRVLMEYMVKAGILRGTVDELIAVGLGPVFFPCGLGHFIGCDTHDVGGYLPHCPPRPQERGICKLRTARILEEGMVLTVEPGIYFIDCLIEPALNDARQVQHIHLERLAQFRRFGGVRLEDVVAITEEGFVNYTICPRTCEEIESVMAGGPWPPEKDTAPELRRLWLS
eukprot:TRINITY_DN11742_c0_g3_i1.p1 TRINITY_DN11742_c0_g3~~TRINITY_DN11742_c0_g3_i1.p1  ORF type:complete len:546 (-),score=55.88 TRINITY_DN11742_c0_g3_i1:157-1794(-)